MKMEFFEVTIIHWCMDSDWQSTWDWCSKFIVTVTLGIITVAGPRGRVYWPPPTHLISLSDNIVLGWFLVFRPPNPILEQTCFLNNLEFSWIYLNINAIVKCTAAHDLSVNLSAAGANSACTFFRRLIDHGKFFQWRIFSNFLTFPNSLCVMNYSKGGGQWLY